MIAILERIFIKNRDQITAPAVRQAYGILCGAVGILLNILLFLGKFIAGLISGSIAVTADAFNNLSDAGSSAITLIGFKLAGQEADASHPFGHGRIEYISGLIVSMIIILMGVELGKTSLAKIMNPEEVQFSILTVIILLVSILVKLYMVIYNRRIGRKINSTVMRATAADSLSDCAATSVVLISMVISKLTGWEIDGYAGILVAAFILYSGYGAARDTINPLLGQNPDPKLQEQIKTLVLNHSEIAGIHDLIVHDYGPGRRMISLHVEVPQEANIMLMHDIIDNIERELSDALQCHAVIHMDPIVTEDEETLKVKERINIIVGSIHDEMSIHDFRMVAGPTHTNLIFDVTVPFGVPFGDDEIKKKIESLVRVLDGNYFVVIEIDRTYVST